MFKFHRRTILTGTSYRSRDGECLGFKGSISKRKTYASSRLSRDMTAIRLHLVFSKKNDSGLSEACRSRRRFLVLNSGTKRRDSEVQLWSSIHLKKTPDYYLRAAKAIYDMSRPWNLVPSFALSFGGGWISSGHNFGVLCRPNLWIVSICSLLVSGASMLANDYYDHKFGTDKINGKFSGMESQEIDPGDVMVASGCLYGMAVLATCFLEPVKLRLSVIISAMVTFIYTPLLKKVTLVKNLAVAGVVANAVAVGGMSTGGATPCCISSYVFFMILGREIIMDAKDVAGDRATGVRSTAVCFGVHRAIALAGICSMVAQTMLVMSLWSNTHSLGCALLTMLSALPLHIGMFSLFAQGEGPDHTISKRVVSEFMLSLATGAVLAATLL